MFLMLKVAPTRLESNRDWFYISVGLSNILQNQCKLEKYNKIGDVVEVEYSQKAEEWNGKWFNKNNVFKINNPNAKQQAHQEIKSSSATGKVLDKQFENKVAEPATQIDDDLPF